MRKTTRRILTLGLAAVLVSGLVPAQSLHAFPAAETAGNTAKTSKTTKERKETLLNGEWQFLWKGEDSTNLAEGDKKAQKQQIQQERWDTVTVPHCWNAQDGADGGNNYRRGIGWYSRTVEIANEELDGRRIFFQCEGASQRASVYVNGEKAGTHMGGYTTFCYDITEKLREGSNVIKVKVDNINGGNNNTVIAPISGDFTVYGGMYRDVRLISTADVHVDAVGETDSATGGEYVAAPFNGLYLTTENVDPEKKTADLTVSAKIVNNSKEKKTVQAKAVLKEQNKDDLDWLEAYDNVRASLAFNPEEMGDGSKKAEIDLGTWEIGSGESYTFEKKTSLEDIRLWNGKADPFRYKVELQVFTDGKETDRVSDYVGFREFHVDKEQGFFLNGKSYPLRGVSRHQDKEGKGYALDKTDHMEDFSLLYEIGANTVRLAHYPQDRYFYDLCDQFGLVVWAEIPFLGGNNTGGASAPANQTLKNTTLQQLRELILQQYNHPAICFWGLQNEVGHNMKADLAAGWMKELNDLAHRLDPSRLTTQATNNNQPYGKNGAKNWPSDVVAWNQYPGWYGGNMDGLGSTMDGKRNMNKNWPIAISEYGAGGNPQQHEFNTKKSLGSSEAGGQWHPEEYQNDLHEAALRAIQDRQYLWATYVWNLIDFGSDSRNEGNKPGINDKGLVSYDRQTKKDSFYLYKANWNGEDSFVYITSRRWEQRSGETVEEVKVYSNCKNDTLALQVNGEPIEDIQRKDEGNGVYSWANIPLQEGENTITVTGEGRDGKFCTDTIVWTRGLSSSTDLSSDVLAVDNTACTIGLAKAVKNGELDTVLKSERGSLELYQPDQSTRIEDENENVVPGMTLKVTAEDRVTTQWYTFTSVNLSYGKTVTTSGDESSKGNIGANIVDLDRETRWASDHSFAEKEDNWVQIDLGRSYYLTSVDITWYNGGKDSKDRHYSYTVKAGEDPEKLAEAVDRSVNTQLAGTVSDSLGAMWGQHVRIDVKGCTQGTDVSASIYEVEVNGYDLSSDIYYVDHENRMITIPKEENPTGALDKTVVQANLKLEGNCTMEVTGESYFVVTGNTVQIQGNDGTVIPYTIILEGTENEVQVKKTGGVISSGKKTSASRSQIDKGIELSAANAVDGDVQSRWSAGNNRQDSGDSLIVDLGGAYALSKFETAFYGEDGRAYQYEILAARADTPQEWVRLVDKTENTASTCGDTVTDELNAQEERSGENAEVMYRYVKLCITDVKAQNGGEAQEWIAPSVYEFKVYGSDRKADVPAEKIEIRRDGEKTEGFTLNKGDSVQLSAKLLPENTTDRRRVSWASETPEVAVVDESGKVTAKAEGTAVITASANIDSRKLTAVCTIRVTDEDRIISEGRTVLFSREEGNSTDGENTAARNINDGNDETRWSAGKTTDGTPVYPAWVTIDLGAEYDISKLRSLFYGSPDRVYTYEILVSSEDKEEAYRTVVDGKGNEKSGEVIHLLEEKVTGRYVRLKVLGSNKQEDWVVPSVCEFSVWGREHVKADVTGIMVAPEQLDLTKGEKQQLNIVFTPENLSEIPEVTWKSSNENIVSVDGKGNVSALAAGTAEVTASVTARSGEVYTAKCRVTVEERTSPGEPDYSFLSGQYEVYKALGLKSSDYTASTWKRYEAAMKAAEKLLTEQTAVQPQIDEVLAELKAAYEGLEYIEREPDGDMSEGDGEHVSSGEDSTDGGDGQPETGKETAVAVKTGDSADSRLPAAGIIGSVLVATGVTVLCGRRRKS